MFPRTIISKNKNSATYFETTQGGARLATTTGGQITGFGADYLILDDPEKPADMDSEVTRLKTKEWFGNSAATRLNDPAKGAIIMVTHRLHEDDLSAHLLEQGNFEHLSFPAVSEADQDYEVNEGDFYTFKKGELLHPSSFPRPNSMSASNF
jgi:hypothetical protein